MNSERYAKQDEQLYYHIQRLQAGYEDSFNEIYNLSCKYIYKIINDIVKEHHTTEDMLQETFIKIYKNIGSLQSPEAYFVWAGRIATNLCISYIRKHSKEALQTSIEDEEGNEEFAFDTIADDNEMFIPESVMENKEHQRMIGAVIDGLSVEQKLAVQCFYFEEMSVKEIAEAMGCSEGTIKSRLNYARKAIKEEVLHIEKTQGTKLYSFAAVPVLLLLYRGYAHAAVASAATAGVGGALSAMSSAGGTVTAASGSTAVATATTGVTGASSVTATAGTTASVAGTATVAAGVSGKIVAIIASIVIALGGTIGGGVIAFNSCEQPSSDVVENTTDNIMDDTTDDATEETTDNIIDDSTEETTETGKVYCEGDYEYVFYSDDNGTGIRVKLNVDDYATRTSFGDILESVDGVSVTDIGDLFNGCAGMTVSPKIPETVINMSGTFAYCASLKEAPELPTGLRYVDRAFTDCTSLVKATEIPAGVESLTETFYRCVNLEEAPYIHSGVKEMKHTFEGCEKLSKVTNIPDTVTDMTYAFFNCYSLLEVPELPAGLKDMTYTFYGCINLMEVPKIPETVITLNNSFGACKSLTKAPEIPDTVTDMESAFAFCIRLVEAPEIPTAVTNMQSTFLGCVSLINAPTIPAGVKNLKRTFYDCAALTGTVIIDANPTEYEECFEAVYLKKQNIEVGGTSAILEEIKATAEKEK